jgi:hypothetical protein
MVNILSSLAMELAFLYEIKQPTTEEKKRFRQNRKSIYSFSSVREIIIARGLLNSDAAKKASGNVIVRRDLCAHDAIIAQMSKEIWCNWLPAWARERTKGLPKEAQRLVNNFFSLEPIKGEIDKRRNLPDLGWYIKKKNIDISRKWLINYIEAETEFYIEKAPNDLFKDIFETEEVDYFVPAAKDNLKDVLLVLEDLYGEPPFKFLR